MKLSYKTYYILFFILYALAHIVFYKMGILSSESQDYTAPVESLINNGSFLDETGFLWNKTPPLFPLWLYIQYQIAVFTGIPQILLTSLFSIVITLFSGHFIYKIVRLVFSENERMARLAMLLFLSCPFIIYATYKPLSLVPFCVLLYASLYYLLKYLFYDKDYKQLIISSVLLGLALLTRPIGILIPLIYALVCIIYLFKHKKRAFVSIAIIASVIALTIAPWTAYNYAKSNQFVLLSSHGVNSIKDGFNLSNKFYREKIEVSEDVSMISNSFYEQREEVQNLGDVLTFLGKKWEEDKGALLNFYLFKAQRVWYGLDSQNSKKERYIKIISILYIILFITGSVLIFRQKNKQYSWLLISILLITFYFWGMAIVVVPLLRYMLPSIGLFMISIAFLGDAYLPKRLRV
ncbi:glycosyltransferase family 39 protein [Kordia jejudonensis]|uniref:glycosyltransferase family 39 protein n=1 Tax=Kordia jejudonensis TaxID=1348245 RepID=UPI000629CE1B|nr:glycosyltransferase family 39 protein [Kordia jejudonensis]